MTRRTLTDWKLCYHGWDPSEQPVREALTTLGNGYFATRGAAEEVAGVADVAEERSRSRHYPGTYLAGGYDRLESEVAGKIVENEDLVNWPNWLPLSFRCSGGDWFDLDGVDILDYSLRLDLFRGVLSRHVRFRDPAARHFTLDSHRLVHMGNPHVAAIEWCLTPLDWSGPIEIRSAIDGGIANRGVDRYRDLDGDHLDILEVGQAGEDAVFLAARARQSRLMVAQAARTRVWVDETPAAIQRRAVLEDRWAAHHLELTCEKDRPVRVEKVLVLYSSRDFAISEPCVEACEHIHEIPRFAELLRTHELAWSRLWHRADLDLAGQDGSYAQLVLRLHIFHMLQTASMNTIGRDVGIPARGLHGEAYRGHIFWDELFMFPYLNLRIPELTRSLLLYRHRRLPRARMAARRAGYRGAMFPWQSGSDGREESQVVHLNPSSGRWIPDNTHRQRHVGAAVAYNVWQYIQATGDMEFLSFYGAELLLEIARFFASMASYSPRRDRYEIRNVVGPDEFHTSYPGKSSPGIDNNAYTNVMAAWVLRTALSTLELLPRDRRQELLDTLDISGEQLHHWEEISRRLYVPFADGGIISQFEGWEELEELDWDELSERHGDLQRLDRVLEAEGRDPNRYKATKQADVLMLFFLFSSDELTQLLGRLGYRFSPERIPDNVEYYLARTSHGSTLSRVVHAWVLARTDRRSSWHLFEDALASDIDDIQGGTTSEGVHLGAMGGTVDLMQRCYTGLEVREGVLWLDPQLPDELPGLRSTIRYRHHWLSIEITTARITVSFEKGWSGPARIGFRGRVHKMQQGQQISFETRPE